MASALVPLEKLQFGAEATPGTLVDADHVMTAEDGGEWSPEIEREEIDEPRGVLAITDDLGVRQGSLLSYTHNLDFEQVLVPLLGGLKEVTADGTDPYTWTITPDVSTTEDLTSFTWEIAYTDGSDNHIDRHFGFSHCQSFEIDIPFNSPATMSSEWFGRHSQSNTLTASKTPLSRTLIPANLFEVWIDDTWAELGDSQKLGTIRSAQLSVETGVGPDYTLDGRSDLDMTQLIRGMITGTLTMTVEVNSTYSAEHAAFESGALRFVRLKAESGAKSLQIDVSGRYIETPSFSRDDQTRLAELTLALRYDPTSTNIISFEVVNALGSI